MLTGRNEDYLETLLSIIEEKNYAQVKDVARILAVSPASVTGMSGFDPVVDEAEEEPLRLLRRELATASGERIWFIADAFRHGMSFAEVHELTASFMAD